MCVVIVCSRREKASQKQYRRAASKSVDVAGQLNESQKELKVVKEKLQRFEHRDESLCSLRRAVNVAEVSVKNLEQDVESLKKERDRAVERFEVAGRCGYR